jgi:AcrR family transcriptional regulator
MPRGAKGTRPRGRLSRDGVLRAALALADERGIEALTMRDLAKRLGTEAMSLYRHVRDKADVLDGITDLVFAEIELPSRARDWKRALRRWALSERQVLARHPWASGLMESRTRPGPANLRHHDSVQGILREAGFSVLAATRAYNILDSYIYGFAIQESSLPFRTPDELAAIGRQYLEQIPADRYPHLHEAATELLAARFDYSAEFDAGLDLILDALERLRGRAQ